MELSVRVRLRQRSPSPDRHYMQSRGGNVTWGRVIKDISPRDSSERCHWIPDGHVSGSANLIGINSASVMYQ